MVFGRIRELLGKNKLPPGTGELIQRVRDTGELLRGLDELVTRNEVAVADLNEELAALEALEGKEEERVRGGGLGQRTRESVLRRILRLRQQMDLIEDRLRIHDRNIRLHLDLIGTLKQIDAMAMAGVGEKEVDAVILGFGEQLRSYQAALTSGEVLSGIEKADRLPGQEDLAALEAEILGERAEAARGPAGAPSREGETEAEPEAEADGAEGAEEQ